MKHVMLDIETLGIRPGSAIIQIGAVDFDLEQNLGEGFKVNINHNLEPYLDVDPATVLWWKRQSPEAKASVSAEPRLDLRTALSGFTSWFDSVQGEFVWGNGATFDNVLVDCAYHACGMRKPWHFCNDRDMRTLTWLSRMHEIQEPYMRIGIEHDGLDDAKTQALWVSKILKRMKEMI